MYMAKNNVKAAGFVTFGPMAGAVSNGGDHSYTRQEWKTWGRGRANPENRETNRLYRRIENLAIKNNWRDELDD